MNEHEDVAWKELETRLAREREQHVSLSEAERRLESGGDEPLSQELIDRIVAEVTRRGGGGTGWPRPVLLRAAAAVLVGGLAVFGAFELKTIVFPSMAQPRPMDLDANDAVTKLVDSEAPVEERLNGLTRVYSLLEAGLRAISEVSGDSPLREDADRTSQVVGLALANAPMPRMPLQLRVTELTRRFQDRSLTISARRSAMRAVAEDLVQGVGLLRATAQLEKKELSLNARVALSRLAGLVPGRDR